jgi:hypothetical protein
VNKSKEKKGKDKKNSIITEKEDFEDEIDEIETKRKGNQSELEEMNSKEDSEDWEKELDKELKTQEKKRKTVKDSRGTSSPIQTTNQINRSAQNLMLNISAAIDIVGMYDKNKPKTTPNKLDIRTAEFGFSGAVDQWIRGNFLAAAHSENGKYYFEVHEAWAQFPLLPFNTSLKVGQMFLDVGRLNKIHAHDRPFTMTPIVHEKFIGWESIYDTGLEFSILFPWKFLTQELVFGATNGKKWGHAHTEGVKKNNPLGYVHLKNFYYFGDNWGTQFGFTGIRFEPTQDRRNQRYMYGFDGILRWNRSNLREFKIMTEYWYNYEIFPETTDYVNLTITRPPKQAQFGYYIFADWKFHQLWSVGYRWDYFRDLSIKDRSGNDAISTIQSNTLQLTFHSSEFGLVRATIDRRFIRDYSQNTDQEKVDQRYYIQTVIILGSHPAHEY